MDIYCWQRCYQTSGDSFDASQSWQIRNTWSQFWQVITLYHFVILSFHFFHSVNYSLCIDIIRKKWFCFLSWSLKGYRIFVFYYRTLLKLFNEIHYWEKLMFETPHYVSELYMKKEDLRILRENVLLVVRDYNRLVLKQYLSLHCHGWHRLLRKKRKKVWV